MIISDLFNTTAWGSSQEHDALLDIGKRIVSYEEEIIKSRYKEMAAELAAGIFCSFLYKNKTTFSSGYYGKPLNHAIVDYMLSAGVIKLSEERYVVTNYYKFEKWLNSLIEHHLPEKYRIVTAYETFTVKYDDLVDAYSKNKPYIYTAGLGRVHPFVCHYLLGFVNETDCSDINGVLAIRTLLDELARQKGYEPFTSMSHIRMEEKKAWEDLQKHYQEVYREKRAKVFTQTAE